jgi:hypothetical protein
MVRYRVIATVIALLTIAAAGSASAGDGRNQGPERLEPQRFDLRINNGVPPDPQHHFRRTEVIVVPQTTYVIQRQCVSPGYWAYQWIPQTYSYTSWVPSQYAPDGAWVDGHYEPRYYNSGYYQPYWVDAAAC